MTADTSAAHWIVAALLPRLTMPLGMAVERSCRTDAWRHPPGIGEGSIDECQQRVEHQGRNEAQWSGAE